MAGDLRRADRRQAGGVSADPLTVEAVTHYFPASDGSGDPLCVLDDVTFRVSRGQFLAIVGTSGCGKTTLLNMMAGLVRPTHGSVCRAGQPADRPDRSIGYMVARAGLLPWRKARANIELGLEFRGIGRAERREHSERLLRMVGLAGFGDAYPVELSQGMRQRVALARTLAVDPDFLFMDEPFAALDAQTKVIVQDEFVRAWDRSDATVVFVTHDLSEAVALADRVIVMSARPGRVKADIQIDLARPRALAEVRFERRFQELAEQVWEALREEVERSHG